MSAVLERANARILRIESGDLNPRTVVNKTGADFVVVDTFNAPRTRYRRVWEWSPTRGFSTREVPEVPKP